MNAMNFRDDHFHVYDVSRRSEDVDDPRGPLTFGYCSSVLPVPYRRQLVADLGSQGAREGPLAPATPSHGGADPSEVEQGNVDQLTRLDLKFMKSNVDEKL